MNYSKGISWFDDCRIPFVDENEMEGVCKSDKTKKTYNQQWGNTIYNYKRTGGNSNGRYPANLLCSDDVLNDGNITKQKKWDKQMRSNDDGFFGGGIMKPENSYGDKGSNSRYYDIDKWFEKMIDEL